MNEPTIICPHCKVEIRLTESLAAPLIAKVREEYQERLLKKDGEIARRTSELEKREAALAEAQGAIDEQVAEKVKTERTKIVAEEARKAKRVLEDELEKKETEAKELRDLLDEKENKLEEAQKTQAEALRKQREFEDAKRELDLTVEKRVKEEVSNVRAQARKEAEEVLALKLRESEETITSMKKQIEDLKRKAEQGSQQLQGEVQELVLEESLTKEFPTDAISPVPKGEHGGDVLQRVNGPAGQPCGTILWESKRTKNWSDSWLAKLRADQRVAKAEICAIVSQALPKEIETFGERENVWIAHPRVALPVALALRQILIETAMARVASEGQQTKMEMVYEYLTGPRFRHRVQAIVEAFSAMHEDLNRERKAITRQWAKREEQIGRVMQATVGMYGDLQGIAGKTLQEVEGLELQALDVPPASGGN